MAAAQQDTTSKPAIDESDLTYHEQLGRGASGDVFRVTWKSKHLGKVEAAAKKIPILKDKVIDEQFWNEIYFLEKLQHPNIIQYYGHIVTSTHVVILTEYAAKGSLSNYLQHQIRLPLELKIRLLLQAARGIQYLKQNKVSHSDIKSDNFVITSAGDLKICDFGISKDLISTEQTAIGRGTTRWQAPEIYTTQERSPTADIFSFGVVAWELETCEVPYKREQPEHLSSYRVEHWLKFKISEGLRPAIPESCPPVLRALMQQCWDGDRNKRPDIDEVVRRLESYQSGLHWQFRHCIDPHCRCRALHWVSQHQLAVCTIECVKVYDVTTDGSQLAYTLTSDEWKGKYTAGVAVSESLPCSMLVICDNSPYVYQYPCHQAEKEIKKCKIQDNQIGLWCIAANGNTAVIGLTSSSSSPKICSLPHFNHQLRVQTSVWPCGLSITSEYLLVMGDEKMLVKPLGDLSQDMCVIRPPDSFTFSGSVCFGDNASEIYAVCDQGLGRGRVFKYTWDDDGDPHYVNTGCIIGGFVGSHMDISLSREGLLAVSSLFLPSNVNVYSLG